LSLVRGVYSFDSGFHGSSDQWALMCRRGCFVNNVGWLGQAAILNASGTVDIFPVMSARVQLVRDDDSPWSDWVDEQAIVRPLGPGVMRLSGVGIRHVLYFVAGPGNDFLAAGSTKGGVTSLL
jgi:hypothetical protein